MIYLPHPKFDFDDVDVIDGGIVGVCYPNSLENCPIPGLHYKGNEIIQINAETVINRFSKAISLYWCKNRTQSVTLGFIREDGAEFAIRFLKSTVFAPDGFGEIIGYWKDIVWPKEINHPDRIVRVQAKREYDRQEYAKFVKWLATQ